MPPRMETPLFYLFAGLALLFGFLVVANPFSRNPVTSAMFLVLTIVALAGLFVLLRAFFLAAVQVLVYAGAVMVLFLFVIMLLNLKEEERRRVRRLALVGGGATVAGLMGVIAVTVAGAAPAAVVGTAEAGATPALGELLFTAYVLPVELVSVLLLVAMVGVVLLSKKEVK